MTGPSYQGRGRRQRYEILRSQLANVRQSFEPHWRELADYIRPRRARFYTGDKNKGDRRNQKILVSTATTASRTLASGMMSGVTSPARQWFRLTLPDPELAESGAVKEWLHTVTQRMNTVFSRSNLYNALPQVYGDAGDFGTAAMIEEEDAGNVVRFTVFPIGSYWIATDDCGRVQIFMRQFKMTVRQLIARFAERDAQRQITNWDRFSLGVRSAYDQQQFETEFDVVHVIEPNEAFNPNLAASQYKAFASCYYECGGAGADNSPDRMLLETGYDEFPVFAVRWGVTGEDVYATDCPGMVVLPDVKQLQKGEMLVMEAMEKQVNPPLVAGAGFRNSPINLAPGGITFDGAAQTGDGVKPLVQVRPEVQQLEFKQDQVKQRIREGYYADLFLMLYSSDRREITAREIDERHEEKLLALGPMLEQLNQDLLNPLIDRTFAIMLRRGLIPQAPEELHGQTLKVEYISIMAQAQKMVGLSGLERFAGFVGNVAATDQAVLDKVNTDELVDEYADATGVPPRVLRSDEDVATMRQQRAQAAQAAQMAENVKNVAGGARDLASADTSGKNALTDLVGATGG